MILEYSFVQLMKNIQSETTENVLKHGGGLMELRSWIGRRNNDGMADKIETETGQV